MKKLIYIIVICFGVYSCESKLDEYGINPNSPEGVTPGLLLSATQVASFSTYSGQLGRLTNIFTQHTAGTVEGSQYLRFSNYDLTEGDFNNEWGGIYTDVLINSKTLIDQFGEGNPYYTGISKIIIAFNLGVATDLWGDVPYSDALVGLEGNKAPVYDSQESIIATIQTLCDEAIVSLKKNEGDNIFLPTSDDLIFGGDVEKWISAAYMLKARYALRLSQIDEAKSIADAIAFLNLAGLTSNEDDMNAKFPDSGGNSRNQWIDFQNQRGNYMKMGKYFIDEMVNSSDPRLPFFATEDASKGYSGNAANDVETTSTSDVGVAIAANTQDIGMLTYVEAKFIEAEAFFRDGSKVAEAQSAFEAAVSASLLKVVGEVDAGFVASATSELSLENILVQKHIALFSSFEPYNDYRRTGFPQLVPNQSSQTKVIPVRLPTPSDERNYNTNATVVSDIDVPVWWDK